MRRSRKNWAADLRLAAAAACVFAAAPAAPAAEDAPERPAYVALVLADQARDRSQWRPSLERYQEALRLFAALAAEKPDYKKESIQYRVDYCRSQIEILKARLVSSGGAAAASDVERVRRENADLRQQVPLLQDQLRKTEDRVGSLPGIERTVAALRSEVAGLQVVAARASQAGSTATAELAGDVAAENVRLLGELERAQSGYLRVAEAMARAESELAEIRAQDSGTQAQRDGAAGDADRVEWARRVARLEAELRGMQDLRRALAEETQARSDWTREKVVLARRIEDLQREAATAARWQEQARAAERRADELSRSAPSVAALVGELDAAKRERDAARTDLDEFARARSAAEAAGRDAERGVGRLERKVESLRAQSERLASKLSQAVEDRDEIARRLQEATHPAPPTGAEPPAGTPAGTPAGGESAAPVDPATPQ